MSVSDLPESSQDQTAKQETSAAPEALAPEAGRKLGRRFILTSMPFAMTLANRPAFATGQTCTISLLASLTNSTPLREDMNCGVSPGCWAQKALNWQGTNGDWQSTLPLNVQPESSFRTTFGMPSAWKLFSPSDTQCANPIDANLYQALTQSLVLVYVPQSGPKIKGTDAGAAKHITAGYLNVLAFNSGHVVNGVVITGHYPVSQTTFNSALLTLWMTPNSATINSQIATCVGTVYQVGPNTQHYCSVGL